jgi:hypothetical protein
MTQDMKSPFAGLGLGFDPFAFGKTGTAGPGAMVPGMGEWVRIQQELMAATVQFSQQAMATAKSDIALVGDVMRKLMSVKTPEEFAAWQRDMSEFVGSKYFEQWTKFGEQVQAIFVKAGEPAPAAPTVEPGGAVRMKKAA